MMGWRKISAWVLIYALVVFATWQKVSLPDNGLDLLIWITGFFFGANSLEHLAGKLSINVGQKTQ